MPGRDGTGPLGMGPMTGWGMGYCAGYPRPVMRRRFFGRGAWGGGGRGWRHWYYATGVPGWARAGWLAGQTTPAPWYGDPYAAPSREQEIEMLKDESSWLKDQLEAINRRMDELTKE